MLILFIITWLNKEEGAALSKARQELVGVPNPHALPQASETGNLSRQELTLGNMIAKVIVVITSKGSRSCKKQSK